MDLNERIAASLGDSWQPVSTPPAFLGEALAWSRRDEPELYAWYERFDGRVNDAGQELMAATVSSAYAAAVAFYRAEAWVRVHEPGVHARYAPQVEGDSSAARVTARAMIVEAAPLARLEAPAGSPWAGDISAALSAAVTWAARHAPDLLDTYHAALEQADTSWQKANLQTAMIGAHAIAPEVDAAIAWAREHDPDFYQEYVDATSDPAAGWPWGRLHAQARLVDTVTKDPDGADALARAAPADDDRPPASEPDRVDAHEEGMGDRWQHVNHEAADATSRAWQVGARLGHQQHELQALAETLSALRSGQAQVDDLARAAREGIDALQLQLAGEIGDLHRVIAAQQRIADVTDRPEATEDGDVPAGGGDSDGPPGAQGGPARSGGDGVQEALRRSGDLLAEAVTALTYVQQDLSELVEQLPPPAGPAVPELPEQVLPTAGDARTLVTRGASLGEGAGQILARHCIEIESQARTATQMFPERGGPTRAAPAAGISP